MDKAYRYGELFWFLKQIERGRSGVIRSRLNFFPLIWYITLFFSGCRPINIKNYVFLLYTSFFVLCYFDDGEIAGIQIFRSFS